MNKITIPVGGMTCGGCAKSVENALSKQAGVSTAKVSLEGKNVTVEFDGGIIQQPALEGAIKKAGFSIGA